MIFSEDSLSDYFTTNFHLMYKHGYILSELENMLPWERSVYVSLLEQEKDKEGRR